MVQVKLQKRYASTEDFVVASVLGMVENLMATVTTHAASPGRQLRLALQVLCRDASLCCLHQSGVCPAPAAAMHDIRGQAGRT